MCNDRESCVKVERIFFCPYFFDGLVFYKYYFINHKKYDSCYERITYSIATSVNDSLYKCLINNKKDCIFCVQYIVQLLFILFKTTVVVQ